MSDWRQMLNADVLTLGMAADEVRRDARGSNVVTYLRVHRARLSTDSGGVAAGALEQQTIPAAAAEVRLYELPPSFDVALEQVRSLRAAGDGRRLAAYSLAELLERGWSAAECRALVAAGLDDVAELPVDRLPNLEEALEVLVGAGASPLRITVSHPLGSNRADIVQQVQHAFARFPTLQRFSPLPRVAPIDKPTTGYDDVRMVAVARLALRDRSIEVDWQLYGPKLAQVALTFGADHLDSVSDMDDGSLGPRRGTIEDVERNIRAAGFEPREHRHPLPAHPRQSEESAR